MTYVIVREKKIGRPIRLKQRRFKTVFAELVFVGINQIGIGIRLQKLHDLEKCIRFEDIVVVKKSDPLPASQLESPIRRSRNPAMFSETSQDDAPVVCGKPRQCVEQVGIA